MRTLPASAGPALVVLALGCSPATDPGSAIDADVNAAADGPILLEALALGDELHVQYASSGCFHSYESALVLARGLDGEVGVTGTLWDNHPDLSTPIPIGRQVLDFATVRGIDRRLALLRAPAEEGWCTTQSDYRLALYRDGKLVREEHLHDGTCTGTNDGKALSDFWVVLQEPLNARYAALAAKGTSTE